MRVAFYARVSTEAQMENYSIPLQLERGQGYCTARGWDWDKVSVFIDGGFSGSNLKRPDMEKMMRTIKDYDVVVVYRLDRLSRSQKDTLHLIEDVFATNNVEFVSISESLDTSTPFGKAMIGILSVFAQLERETITERLRGGRYKMVVEEGLWAGGAAENPAGYIRLDRGALEINEDEMFIVERLFAETIKMRSITKAMKKLVEEGIDIWRYRRCRDILTNRLYVGEVSFAGEWYKGSHEVRISQEDFDEVQVIVEERKGKNAGKIKHMLLSGKLSCGCCGEKLLSYSKQSRLADGTVTKYFYYVCKRRKMPVKYPSKCMNNSIKRDALDKAVLSAIDNLTYDNFKKEKKLKTIDYGAKISKVEDKIKKILDLYLDDNFDKPTLDIKLTALNDEKNKLSLAKSKQDEESTSSHILDFFKSKRIKTSEMSTDEKLSAIALLVKQVRFFVKCCG